MSTTWTTPAAAHDGAAPAPTIPPSPSTGEGRVRVKRTLRPQQPAMAEARSREGCIFISRNSLMAKSRSYSLSLDGRGKGEGVTNAANIASRTPSGFVRTSLFQKRRTR